MKIKVTTAGLTFEVEVGDLHARPVVATIEGERFEVWPEGSQAETHHPDPPETRRAPLSSAAAASPDPNAVYAPLPGLIVSIAVQPGAAVTVGQELCALEAMKMKNILRASRAGRIAEVRVSVGQFVKHRQLLMAYGE